MDTNTEILRRRNTTLRALLTGATGIDLLDADTPLQADPLQDRDKLSPSSIQDLPGKGALGQPLDIQGLNHDGLRLITEAVRLLEMEILA